MKSSDHHHLQAFVLLRAIVDLAKIGVAKGFIRGKMLWAMSLYLENGHFSENWRSYHRISDAARLIRDSNDEPWKERKKEITFEHARTLREMYKMLVDESASLTLVRAAQIIGEYPPVLIRTSEDKEMQRRDPTFKFKGAPEDRYKHIPISEFNLRSDRYRHFFALIVEAQEAQKLSSL
jgi:hypothetical protein